MVAGLEVMLSEPVLIVISEEFTVPRITSLKNLFVLDIVYFL
jgi:hypothetical protein